MVELSHRPLREMIASFGSCDRYYTEMTSAAGYLAHSPFDRWFTDSEPEPGRTVVQLYASEPGPMIETASRLAQERRLSGIPLGGLDANFGCSAPQIEKAGGGVSWMKDAKRAASMLAGIKSAAPGIPLSAKLRLGYDDAREALVDFCLGLQEAGADYLVIHPRLWNEKFRRKGRWDSVRAVAEALAIPVVGNGDVRDYEGCRNAFDEFGVAGVMIGREAVRRPWIFSLLRGKEANPSFEMTVRVEDVGLGMIESIRALLPRSFHVSRARRFFFYYCDNLSFGHHVRYAIQNCDDLDGMAALFAAYFVEVPSDRVKLER